MNILGRARHLFGVSAAAAILVSCSGARQSQGAIPPIGT
jgi:hypothetical protein